MNKNLNTLLTTLYVFITDHVIPNLPTGPRRGRPQLLSDAELLCLAVAQHLLHADSSETRWIRYARTHLKSMFPNIPQQSGYNKRIRAAAPLIAHTLTTLAQDVPTWHDVLRLLDSTPVPCGQSRETVKRSDLAGQAGYGYCASHSRYFWGLRLYLLCTPEGMPVVWGLANPKIGEREAIAAMLEASSDLVADGQVILADKGFAGKEFETFITADLKAHLLRPDRKDETPRFGDFGGIRQWVESVFDTLKGQLGLERHGARTLGGVMARVASKLLAMAAGIWHNWKIDAPRKRSLTAYDH
ncbi:IS982 family transposase [Glutamicibacter creatinolyticus]|uniref:IS982 family transposase n=1 Tax=Glutamicibacter creatinolyticus TaxID=162496 RepID=UPI0037C18F46